MKPLSHVIRHPVVVVIGPVALAFAIYGVLLFFGKRYNDLPFVYSFF